MLVATRASDGGGLDSLSTSALLGLLIWSRLSEAWVVDRNPCFVDREPCAVNRAPWTVTVTVAVTVTVGGAGELLDRA